MLTTTVSYVAQALVAAIVGLKLGFRLVAKCLSHFISVSHKMINVKERKPCSVEDSFQWRKHYQDHGSQCSCVGCGGIIFRLNSFWPTNQPDNDRESRVTGVGF